MENSSGLCGSAGSRAKLEPRHRPGPGRDRGDLSPTAPPRGPRPKPAAPALHPPSHPLPHRPASRGPGCDRGHGQVPRSRSRSGPLHQNSRACAPHRRPQFLHHHHHYPPPHAHTPQNERCTWKVQTTPPPKICTLNSRRASFAKLAPTSGWDSEFQRLGPRRPTVERVPESIAPLRSSGMDHVPRTGEKTC